MPEAPKPATEAERIQTLQKLGILDTAPEERFDRITDLAQRIFDVPIALLSLVDINRQWFKSCRGLPDVETPRSMSFCAYAILQDDPLIIPDAQADPRFVDNPLVTGEPFIRFYAGQPLKATNGQALGTLCIIGREPRVLGRQEIDTLKAMAAWAESELNRVDMETKVKAQIDAEERLARELEFSEQITRSLGGGLYVVDCDGMLRFMNPAAEQALGWTQEELMGKDVHEIIHFQRADGGPLLKEDCPLLGVLASGIEVRIDDDVFTRKNGSLLPVAYTSSPIMRNGAIDGAVLAFRDMTAQRRVERAIQDQSTFLRRQSELLDLANNAIMVRDLDTSTILFWSRGAEDLYGWTAQEAVGRESHSLFRTDFPVPLEEIEETLSETGKWEGELVHSTRDGSRITVASRWSLRRDEQGRPEATLEINSDITQRKLDEQRLRELLSNLRVQYEETEAARGEARAVLDAASDAMALVSPRGQFLTINHRFTEIFGVTADEVLNERPGRLGNWLERIFIEGADVNRRWTTALADHDGEFTEVVAQQWPDRRELSLFSTPVRTTDNTYLGRLFVFRDVSREREVDRMKSEFISMVSHELRTPLTSIKGYVDLLYEGEVGEVSGEQHEFLGIVRNNADRLMALVNDLLDVSRIEAGKVQLEQRVLELGPLIEAVATGLHPQIQEKDQSLTIQVADGLPSVHVDAARVTQILTNLVSNAYKYTPREGNITISASPQGDTVRVEVQDTGVGLSAEEQGQVFSRFFRARNRAIQDAGGTGLGLAITRSLVEMQGGEISVASAPGQGSTFSFTLPVAKAEQAEKGPVAPTTARNRILVVDDEPDVANLIRRYLERAGYWVRIAGNGKEALQMAAADQPDLIILDVLMPDIDGFAVLEAVKHQPETAHIPVVLLSILDDNGQGKLLGASAHLTKPVPESVLLTWVRKLIIRTEDGVVLVADDDEDIRSLMARQLRQTGYTVLEAADGRSAVELARREHPEVAFIDLRMPQMDGIAVLRELRADPAMSDIRIIIMTTSPGVPEDSQSAVEALGSVLLLAKPYTAADLAGAIAVGLQAGNDL